ncbi:MAG: RIP metalloprotease RseP [Bacteroidales bacterium]|nr:RIP metalloprotease RseP [Bacteroidales bacterium]
MKWLALILSLTLLVATHELGHLLFAKLFHTRVRRYYIFFNWKFSLIKAKKFGGKWHFRFFNAKTPDSWDEKNLAPEDQNNTLWGLGWIPLGGYCDIAGMIDETKDEKDLEATPQPWEYRTKPAWQRLCIISGGVLVNFISALLIYGMIFAHWGSTELPMQNATYGYAYHEVLQEEGFKDGDVIRYIDGKEYTDASDALMTMLLDNPSKVSVLRGDSLVDLTLSGTLSSKATKRQAKQLMTERMSFVVKDFVDGSAAERAGLMRGDSLVSINGDTTIFFHQVTAALKANANDSVSVGFYRNGELMSARMLVPKNGRMGVYPVGPEAYFELVHIDYTFWQAIPAGISHGWETLVDYVSSLRMLFSDGGMQSLGGFGTMASIFPNHWDWQSFWNITALLALILAFMNIIPIPGLDGGHIIFTLWEIISGRKPSDKFLSVAQNIGMFLLLALMILANGNDILRWLGLM